MFMKHRLPLTVVLAGAFVFGCETNDQPDMVEVPRDLRELEEEILWDLTPELFTETGRGDDAFVHLSRRFNHDIRMFWDDWGRIWYFDRPTRLTPRPRP